MQDMIDYSTQTLTTASNEPFFPIGAGREGRMAMTIVKAAKGTCSIADLYEFCTSMPATVEERDSPDFRRRCCGKWLEEAYRNAPDDPDVNLAADYVLGEWCRMSAKTSTGIQAHLMNVLEKFMYGTVRELVAGGTTNVTPDDVMNGKIVVVDMPILKYRQPGQFVQMVWKLLTQRAVLGRKVTADTLPVCIWADEAQLHALPQVDSMTQAVARSQRLIQVAITQNLPLLISTLKSREDALSWLANLQNKFIFGNGCMDTCHWASQLIGSSRHLFMGGSSSQGEYDLVGDMWGGESGAKVTGSFNEQWHPDVPPEVFASDKMRKGGPEYGFMVDFYLHRTGARFPQNGNKAWLKVAMKQYLGG